MDLMIGNRCLNERVACVLCYIKLMSICKKMVALMIYFARLFWLA